MKKFFLVLCLTLAAVSAQGQAVPSVEENIPFLVTFGNRACTSWGDDDFTQIWFFIVPESYKGMVFFRVFDPDVGGENDELNGSWDTRTQYSVYGGRGAYTHPDAQEPHPTKGNFKSGTLLATRTFGFDPRWDNRWFSFGPFNPTDGEYYPDFGGYVFKVVCQGISGDDGNMYRYFMSSSSTENIPIEGGNAFTHKYTFRLPDDPKQVSHIYPFIHPETTRVRIENFDWDDDGIIRVTSEVRRETLIAVSGDNAWAVTEFAVLDGERGKSLDIQFIRKGVRNNNVVINVRNQRGDVLKFWSSPIGGVPRYNPGIQVRKVNR